MVVRIAGSSELKGETIPFGEHVLSYTRREPLGVVGAIIPWNAPGPNTVNDAAHRSLDLASGPHQVELDYYAKGGWGKTTASLGIVRPETLVRSEAKTLAQRADAVILAVGFDPASEGESGDRTFQLPPGQDELIGEIAALNKNSVVVVTSGGGVDMAAPVLVSSYAPAVP